MLVFLLRVNHVVSVLIFKGPRGRSQKFGAIVTLSRVQAYWRVSYKCMFAHGGTLPDSSVPKQHLTGTAPCWRTAGWLAERCTPPKAEG